MSDDCVKTLIQLLHSFSPYMDPVAKQRRGFILRSSHLWYFIHRCKLSSDFCRCKNWTVFFVWRSFSWRIGYWRNRDSDFYWIRDFFCYYINRSDFWNPSNKCHFFDPWISLIVALFEFILRLYNRTSNLYWVCSQLQAFNLLRIWISVSILLEMCPFELSFLNH